MNAAVLGLAVLLACSLPLGAQAPGNAWSEKWKTENKQWIAFLLDTMAMTALWSTLV
jgi:hypothetical protein